MKLATRRGATLIVAAALSLALLAPAASQASPTAAPGAGAAKACKKGQKNCGKGNKGKKKGKGAKNKGKGKGGKGTPKPSPGPYREGQTCAMSEQAKYAKYGFVCIDISTPGFPLTVLAPL